MAEIVVRIGSSASADYADFSSAESNITGQGGILDLAGATTDLENDGNQLVFEFEGETHTFSSQVTFNAGLNTGPNGYAIFRPVSGAEHGGEWKKAGCAVLKWTGSSGDMIRDQEPYSRYYDLCVELAGNNGALAPNGIGSEVHRCMIIRPQTVNPDQTVTDYSGAKVLGATTVSSNSHDPYIIENCYFETNSSQFIRFLRWTDLDFEVNNCTFNKKGSSSPNLAFLKATRRDCTNMWRNNVIYNGGRGFVQYLNSSGWQYTGDDPLDVPHGGQGNVIDNGTISSSLMNTAIALSSDNQWTFTTNTSASSTGDTIVWDDSQGTGLLYDVAGNDAWQALTDLTGAPTTDIEGTTRSTSGFNPGYSEADAAGGGTTTITGTGSGALSGISGSGTGSSAVTITGTGTGDLSGVAASSLGATSLGATGAGDLSGLTGESLGATSLGATGAGDLSGLTGESLGQTSASGLGTGALTGLSGTSLGSVSVSGVATAALAGITGSASGGTSLNTGTGSLSGLSGQGLGSQTIPSTAAAVLSGLRGVASGFVVTIGPPVSFSAPLGATFAQTQLTVEIGTPTLSGAVKNSPLTATVPSGTLTAS